MGRFYPAENITLCTSGSDEHDAGKTPTQLITNLFREIGDEIERDLFARLERHVASCNNFTYVRGKSMFHIYPRGDRGFPIYVLREGGCYYLVLGPWYDEVSFPDVVFRLVEKALSGELRIRIDRRQNRDRAWAVETRAPDGEWIEIAKNSRVEIWPRGPMSVRYLSHGWDSFV